MLSASKQNKNESTIHVSKDIRDILKKCSFDTFVAIDLDNTTIESTKELGSDQWFVKLIEYACKIVLDKEDAIRSVIAIYHAVQHHTSVKPVEPAVVKIITVLQDIGIPVLAVTARGTAILAPTMLQLSENGIDFSKKWGEENFTLAVKSKSKPMFCNGILFCDGSDKTICLEAFWRRRPQSIRHLLMIDDKEVHLLPMQSLADRRGIRFDGLRYAYLDEKVANMDMEAATRQLLQIIHLLSDEAQEAIEKLSIKSLLRNSIFKLESTQDLEKTQTQEEKYQPIF